MNRPAIPQLPPIESLALQCDGRGQLLDAIDHRLRRLCTAALEESGVAPDSAANRKQPLPVILTEQKDAGIRFNLTKGLKAVAGVFDLSRPYLGFDSATFTSRSGR